MVVVRRLCEQRDIYSCLLPCGGNVFYSTRTRRDLSFKLVPQEPLNNFRLSIQPVKIHDNRGHLKRAHFVSEGARFLFTTSPWDLLQLWDIGFIWDPTPDWLLAASVQLNHGFPVEVLPSRDGI